MRRSGRLNSATAKATLILCPPERYFTGIMALPPRIPNGIKIRKRERERERRMKRRRIRRRIGRGRKIKGRRRRTNRMNNAGKKEIS